MTNRKTTKRALFTSTLALLMCVAMLIGTTFAWFTDTATTNVNKIEAGKLDVALEMKEGYNWVSAEGKTLNFIKADGATSETVLWEPGCAYKLPTIKVVNNGNLALKYNVQFSAVSGDLNLAKVLDVYVSGLTPTESAPDQRAATTGTAVVDETLGVRVGTLYDALTSTDPDGFSHGNLAANADSGELTITVKMQETAGNDYQELAINGIAVIVHATQDTVESDSFSNQYDADATLPVFWDGTAEALPSEDEDGHIHITSAAQLATIMNNTQTAYSGYNDKTFVLDTDVDFGGQTIKGFGSDQASIYFTFDGNNHAIRNFKIENTREWYSGLFNQVSDEGEIKNLTVEGATVIGKKMVGVIASGLDGATIDNCHVKNCTVISGMEKAGAITGYTSYGTVKNCTATDVNVFCADDNVNESGEIVGYVNTGSTVQDNTATNVTVTRGATNVFAVSTAAELAAALGTAKTIVLTKDIDMAAWATIANMHGGLTIEGNGHSLKNLPEPLFKEVDSNNYTFKNVTVDNANFDTSATDTGNSGYGTFICEVNNNAGGAVKFENCTVKNSSIKAHKYAGAFVGFTAGGSGTTTPTMEFTDCTVSNTTVETEDSSCGGFIGHNWTTTTLTNCKVLGNTSVSCTEDRSIDSPNNDAKAGWFVGTVNGGTTTLTNCTNSSTGALNNVNAKDPLANGFVGRRAATGTLIV